jgi:hypothetical protein
LLDLLGKAMENENSVQGNQASSPKTMESIIQLLQTKFEQFEARMDEKFERQANLVVSQREASNPLNSQGMNNPPLGHDEASTSHVPPLHSVSQPFTTSTIQPLPHVSTTRQPFGMNSSLNLNPNFIPLGSANHVGNGAHDQFHGHQRASTSNLAPWRDPHSTRNQLNDHWNQPMHYEEERQQGRELHHGIKLQVQTFSGTLEAVVYFDWVTKMEAVFDYYRYQDAQ